MLSDTCGVDSATNLNKKAYGMSSKCPRHWVKMFTPMRIVGSHPLPAHPPQFGLVLLLMMMIIEEVEKRSIIETCQVVPMSAKHTVIVRVLLHDLSKP